MRQSWYWLYQILLNWIFQHLSQSNGAKERCGRKYPCSIIYKLDYISPSFMQYNESMNTRNEKKSWYERVPKVELHLHLTGAIPHTTLWELIIKYGGDTSIPDINALEEKFKYRDFTHFMET